MSHSSFLFFERDVYLRLMGKNKFLLSPRKTSPVTSDKVNNRR